LLKKADSFENLKKTSKYAIIKAVAMHFSQEIKNYYREEPKTAKEKRDDW